MNIGTIGATVILSGMSIRRTGMRGSLGRDPEEPKEPSKGKVLLITAIVVSIIIGIIVLIIRTLN